MYNAEKFTATPWTTNFENPEQILYRTNQEVQADDLNLHSNQQPQERTRVNRRMKS